MDDLELLRRRDWERPRRRSAFGLAPLSHAERLISGCAQSGDCWEWMKNRNQHGYGMLTVGSRVRGDRKLVLASRLSYETFIGPIPSKMLVCHTCDNRACIRPEHLFVGTHADNYRDMIDKGRVRLARGVRARTAKLTDEAVVEIRARRKLGEKIRALAACFGVNESTIKSVVYRKSWAHVPDETMDAVR